MKTKLNLNRRQFVCGAAAGAIPVARGATSSAPGATPDWSAHLPEAGTFDVCVVGGSCTGVFAALRAAEQGLRVAVDIHEGGGITFKYLNGRMGGFKLGPDGHVISLERKRWRAETPTNPTSYAIPYRAIVPKSAENVLAPGRALDSSREALGACRVMVNCNQMGESAGLAAARAVKERLPAAKAYAGRGGAA